MGGQQLSDQLFYKITERFMQQFVASWVNKIPNISGHENWLTAVILSAGVAVLAILAYLVAKRVVVHLIHSVFTKTQSRLDDVLVSRRVFSKIAYLAPSWVCYKLLPDALHDYAALAAIIETIIICLLYTSPSPRDLSTSRMPSSA